MMELSVYEEMAALETGHWWFGGRREILRAVLRRHLGPRRDLAVLDVGAGTGGNLDMLAEFGRVWALEPHAAALRALPNKDVTVVPGVVPETSLGLQFDLICLLDVLEHIDDDRAAMAWTDRHLRPGGLVVVTVPAYRFLWSGHDVAHHHRRRYTRRQVAEVYRPWTPRTVSYFNTVLFLPIVAVRLAGRILDPVLRRPPRSHAQLCPEPVNSLLKWIFASERWAILRWPLPFGVSILGVFEKPGVR